MKRFWTTVAVEGGTVLIDGRPVKSPGQEILKLPIDLAEAVADEWRAVADEVKMRDMPLTRLANVAIDGPPAADMLAVYGETDLLCYRAEAPPELIARQAARWDPLLDWARQRYDVAFAIAAGIIHKKQPHETVIRLAKAVATLTAFERTALSPLVTIGGSLVVALMIYERTIEAGAAFDACHLDELWQAELWGEDWMATDARAARRADFLSAAQFLTLL